MHVGGRALKNRILKLLKDKDSEKALHEICRYPSRQVVNPLFSFFYSIDAIVKWRAVTAMGQVVATLVEKDMESARVVMRRLMWNLNDESGGIGWGSPEAMGEIMACHQGLAEEYACILASYLMKEGNYIEHEALQKGVLWGFGRLAHARPHLLKEHEALLLPFLESRDATARGLAAWGSGPFNSDLLKPALRTIHGDSSRITIYLDRLLVECTVGKLVHDALTISEK
jgi:HEAT-like repeat protein